MDKRAILAAVLFIVIAAIVVVIVLTREAQDKSVLVVSGSIEVTDALLSFKIPGRLLERLVDEGEQVEAGELVARLDPTDQQLLVAQAEANVAYAESVLAELEAGSRPEQISQAGAQVRQAQAALDQLLHGSREQEIAEARAAVEQAEAGLEQAQVQLDLARADFERSAQLYELGVIPRQRYDAAEASYQAAAQALEAAHAGAEGAAQRLSLVEEGPRQELIEQARANLSQAQASYALIVAGPRTETIAQAEAQLTIARENLRQVQQQLAYTELRASFAGVVLSKAAEPGEYLNPGSPVVTVGQLDQVWLRGYVNEYDLGRVRLGQRADVSTDTYPDKTYEGRLSFISNEAEFTPKAVQTFAERVKLMYRIKIDVANPDHELKPGMPADAVISLAE